ncbi:MAG: 50S ribosomal protein L2, partial [Candidatus Aureabacteria bacterium]|nr:50S ribosomal protein L2 [Candidatus Auribacterota bacterium]
MTLKKFKPVTPSLRFTELPSYKGLSKVKPHKPLLLPKKSSSGRNVYGRVTMRRRGGGHKKQLRILDFKREKYGIPAKVGSLEYDPNRTARIALLHYADGEKRYILAPEGIKVGDVLMSGPDAEPKVGNALPIEKIPVGMIIHNIELKYKQGGSLVRSAGSGAVLMACEGNKAQLKLPSGEIRMVDSKNMATVGAVGNAEHNTVDLGKAGRSRWLGIRPSVRGVAMNPVDHPHGG